MQTALRIRALPFQQWQHRKVISGVLVQQLATIERLLVLLARPAHNGISAKWPCQHRHILNHVVFVVDSVVWTAILPKYRQLILLINLLVVVIGFADLLHFDLVFGVRVGHW